MVCDSTALSNLYTKGVSLLPSFTYKPRPRSPKSVSFSSLPPCDRHAQALCKTLRQFSWTGVPAVDVTRGSF